MNKRKLISFCIFLLLFFSFSLSIYGDPDGRTGRTRKNSTSGCGSCHGSSATTGVTVSINGPDTVITGQSVQFSMVITRSTKTGAGIDIATRRGTLTAVSPNTRVSNGEITNNINLSMTSGTITILFRYNAPATAGADTIWSTGLATNSNGGSSGDEWNWSPNRQVYVRVPTGVSSNTELINSHFLAQNFPNPFNPETVIEFGLPKSEYAELNVYDASGKFVKTLLKQRMSAGRHTVNFNAAGLNSGIYYYSIAAGDYKKSCKMILLK